MTVFRDNVRSLCSLRPDQRFKRTHTQFAYLTDAKLFASEIRGYISLFPCVTSTLYHRRLISLIYRATKRLRCRSILSFLSSSYPSPFVLNTPFQFHVYSTKLPCFDSLMLILALANVYMQLCTLNFDTSVFPAPSTS